MTGRKKGPFSFLRLYVRTLVAPMKGTLIAFVSAGLLGGCTEVQEQRADPTFVADVARATHGKGTGPLVSIDAGHHNFHTRDGRYAPFAKLLLADGYRVASHSGELTRQSLFEVDALVIANALHKRNVELWTLPTPSAFTEREIDVLVNFVEDGGALFLIADHMPFPGAVKKLAARFGVNLQNGFAFAPDRDGRAQGTTQFKRDRGQIGDHPITRGRSDDEAIREVATFTGTAFSADADAVPLLVFGDDAFLLTPVRAWKFDDRTPRTSIEGWLQGAALERGKGRVVVFGEAAMFTSQRGAGGKASGMGSPRARDNQQLLLNILRWLTRA